MLRLSPVQKFCYTHGLHVLESQTPSPQTKTASSSACHGVSFRRTSTPWCELHMVLGVLHTNGYYPQANGMVKWFYHSLRAALKSYLHGPHWMDEPPVVLIGLRTTWKKDLYVAPALLAYVTNLRVSSDFFSSLSAN